MRKAAIQLLISASIFSTSNVLADTIKNIEILGLGAISRGAVLSNLPVETGDNYDTQVGEQVITDLYKTGFFKDIEVYQENKILKIKLLENPHIKYIDIVNYSDKVLDEKGLNRIMEDMDLIQGNIFDEKRLDKFITKIKEAYNSKGYYNTSIIRKINTDTQNRAGIEIKINEGEAARINSMNITGNAIHSEKTLLNLFDIGEADFAILNFFNEKDRYSKVALDAGIESMKSLYVNSGYLDFKIKKIDTVLSNDKKKIDINIKINEGTEYKIGVINFTGNLLNQSTEDLNALLTINEGDIFKRIDVIESIKAITNVFSNQGYAFAKINPITNENTKTHAIDLTIDVALNKKVYINRIIISGNTRTQDEVIRREIGINEGGIYSNEKLDESIKKIKRLGFFSDVKMKVSKLEKVNDKIDLKFKVTETKTGTFSVGLSHSNESGAAFNIGIKEKNFLGTGNTLNSTLSNSEAVQEMNFYFSDPYFTTDGHSISYGVFAKNVDGSELSVSSYKINEVGASLGYGIPLTKDTRIKFDLRASNRDITCGDQFKSADYEEEQCTSGDSTEVKTNIAWSNNTLNNFSYPTEGVKNKINFDLALPIADFRYYKLDASHRSYRPLGNDLTWKLNGNIGLAQGYGGKELPFFERYYGGGNSSVRGFEFNSLGATYDDGKAKGGELSLLASTSIISPMKFISDSKNMRMSAFVDVGSVEEKVKDVKLSDLRVSAGVAFSWLTPVGPLGVYIAEPLVKEDTDETKTMEFTLGTSF
jgi:outer membrane protein insertion porin family